MSQLFLLSISCRPAPEQAARTRVDSLGARPFRDENQISDSDHPTFLFISSSVRIVERGRCLCLTWELSVSAAGGGCVDWNNPRTRQRYPPSAYDVILISDVVWADGYGRLPTTYVCPAP
jgi:hypothetical protein